MKGNLKGLLPVKIVGWDLAEKDTMYQADNLYEYINGDAELFLSYGFRQMIARIYCAPDQPDILVDLFDMGESRNAYGIFSYSREKEDTTFGQGSQYSQGLLLFWKDRYYVSIMFSVETKEAKRTAFNIAREIESHIESEGALPEVLNILPQENLIEASIRYFRHYIWLNSYYFISNENILNINDSTDALFAKYEMPDDNPLLLIVKYPGISEAEKAQIKFISAYAPNLRDNRVLQHNEQWIGCQVDKNIFVVIFKAKKKENVLQVLEEVSIRINQY